MQRRLCIVCHVVGTILFGMVLFPSESGAELRTVNITDAFNRASAVLEVQVDGQQEMREHGKVCGIRYVGAVLATFKGTLRPNLDRVSFGRDGGLTYGGRYLIFLNYVSDPVSLYDALVRERNYLPEANREDRDTAITLLKCAGTIPGLIFDTRAAWEVKLSYVIARGLRPDLPDSIRLSSPETLLWVINKDDLFLYLRSISPH
jgi:hypothetical protein